MYNRIVSPGIDAAAAKLACLRKPQMIQEAEKGKKRIADAADAKAVLRLLRAEMSPLNRKALLARALEFEEELMPTVLTMLVTSRNDDFIDNATQLLILCKKDYSAELLRLYDSFADVFSQSMVCLILGFRAGEETIPWMFAQYEALKNAYPSETYSEGPLLALYEFNHRFNY